MHTWYLYCCWIRNNCYGCRQTCKTSNIGGLIYRDWGHFVDNPLLASNALGLSGGSLVDDGLDTSDKGSHTDSLNGCLSIMDGT